MTHRSAVPVSPVFDGIAGGARFRDRIAVVVQAPPAAIFRALHEVTLRDMKLAWALGEVRNLPSRLIGASWQRTLVPWEESCLPSQHTL